jgi:GNAT superfamily N-acetyltransferase
MRNIIINNINYGFIRDFKHNKDIRTSFNNLTEVTFGFNLEEWYLGGYWDKQYLPYSLLHDNKVISNVSVSTIEFIIAEEKKIGIQIGTVMTEKEYRNRGLNKYLLEQVLDEWKEKADFIYLFANSSVLEFYPKFNFEIVNEYQYSKLVNDNSNTSSIKRLNIEDAKEKEFLEETLKMSVPISKVSMYDNTSLIMFYCISIKKNSIYYIEVLKTIVIAEFDGDKLYLNDVFCKENVSLNDVIKVMSGKDVKKVVLGFTPLNATNYNSSLLKADDTLFILKDKVDYFKDNPWMFPVLSHA